LTDDRLKLLSIDAQPAEQFLQSMATDERSAVIFIPGYNVSFEAAALRAAQIGFDLSVRGAMAFFSWPSRGTLQGYTDDEVTIDVSEDTIADFMVQVVERSGAHAVHGLAHSMVCLPQCCDFIR
jgi:esterase/lipase superfamily enzyme